MLNKLGEFLRSRKLVDSGDTVICAVSGGADSVALLFGMYLLREKLGIRLEAAHFNHHLRLQESDRDECFVRELCSRFEIPLYVGGEEIKAGKKGLEAAAREARYRFLESLPGKIATAHTADDNAETVLMHLIRGTGLKGLGGIAPKRGKLIRPMLSVTRREVEAFLEEWSLPHVEDSSNRSDLFLRNRIRARVMPLLMEENPRLPEKLSAMALGLREDEAYLSQAAAFEQIPPVDTLRTLPGPIRRRMLEEFLKNSGVREPEQTHIQLAEQLVFSERPSAKAAFPGGVTLSRRYDCLEALGQKQSLEEQSMTCPGTLILPGLCVRCFPATEIVNTRECFTVCPEGKLTVRPRRPGDEITLSGGTKSLKKLFIDCKIPQSQRETLPVLCDEQGILGVYSIGVHQKRAAQALPAVTICFEKRER